jgi:hypothetical protein
MPLFRSHERLKEVFDHHTERLMRRFGLSYGHIRKWMRETDDPGTGTPSPLQRVRDLIDEAMLIDPTGAGASLIAQDAPEYLDELMARRAARAHWSAPTEALELLKEADDVIQRLGRLDVLNVDSSKLQEVYQETVELGVKCERVKGLVLQAMRSAQSASGLPIPDKGGGR